MTTALTTPQLGLILTALNDREGVLATNYEAARRANSDARVAAISAEMRDVRALADLIANQLLVAKRLANGPARIAVEVSDTLREAAPDLLAACSAMLEAFETGEHYETRNPYARPYVKAAIAAIAKATGA